MHQWVSFRWTSTRQGHVADPGVSVDHTASGGGYADPTPFGCGLLVVAGIEPEAIPAVARHGTKKFRKCRSSRPTRWDKKIERRSLCRTREVLRFLKILFASCLESRIKCYTSICGLSHPLVLMVREHLEGRTSMIDGCRSAGRLRSHRGRIPGAPAVRIARERSVVVAVRPLSVRLVLSRSRTGTP